MGKHSVAPLAQNPRGLRAYGTEVQIVTLCRRDQHRKCRGQHATRDDRTTQEVAWYAEAPIQLASGASTSASCIWAWPRLMRLGCSTDLAGVSHGLEAVPPLPIVLTRPHQLDLPTLFRMACNRRRRLPFSIVCIAVDWLVSSGRQPLKLRAWI